MLSQPTTSVCSSCAPCSTSCPRFVNRTEFNSSTLDPHLHNFSSANAIALIDLESSRAHIFSVSSRNADGLRIKRTREMRASCLAFGIPSPHCIVLDHSELPGRMSVWRPEDTMAEYPETITFDHGGVSGHANH
ncbi:hypothetical protein PtA15_9A453 [Puccinia triticina]|uniref:N-acetylglucosaminylphosphatidylinositol deacetylase n=1 Tax=Puccinia triticina TaxID=208348 RepID=A0ABY7CST5_9BASI|nr:uncharacterized protein PtA15_9A453 [Puccinia triticina]WAQ88326.1 hypothetical protein PtA15_9A453 [Puccinia triticina]WAR60505.1 hypothetical protein PtB15_9B444 [Puccinia triticina]